VDTFTYKIDPALNKFIRIHVVSLEQFERSPMEGKFSFPPDFIEPIVQKSGWQGPYDSDLSHSMDLFSFIAKTGAFNKKDLTPYFKIISLIDSDDHKSLLKTCYTMIKTLPEDESRQFYIQSLKPYKDASDLKSIIDSSEKANLDFYSVIFSLITRYLYVKCFEDEKPVKDDQIEYFKKSNAVLSFLNVTLSLFSQIANSITLTELKQNISKGDDKALFKAVTIDKSILYLEEVKARVLTAQLTGDSKFFTKLAKAIADNPLKRIGQHGKTYAVLKLFWYMGLYVSFPVK
jgi:hypothetical protein